MEKNKIKQYSGIVISILVILVVIVFTVFQKNSKSEMNTVVELATANEQNKIEQASISMDNKVNEQSIESDFEVVQDDEEKNQVTAVNNKFEQIENQSVDEEKEVSVDTSPSFIMPVEGKITRDYAKDKLIYSDTLKEWVTHVGIDIESPKTTIVKASAKGTVTAIKNDPRFGLSVIIEHSGGYSTIYSNLLTAEFIDVGEEVEQGETIGTVGNTAAFEVLDSPHLHFEILKDGVQVDPNMYL